MNNVGANEKARDSKGENENKRGLKHYPAIRVSLLIEGTHFWAMLDSGAGMTCISMDLYSKLLSPKVKLEQERGLTLTAANRLPLAVQGVCQITFLYKKDLGEGEIRMRVGVVSDLVPSIILGRDFAASAGCGIDPIHQVVCWKQISADREADSTDNGMNKPAQKTCRPRSLRRAKLRAKSRAEWARSKRLDEEQTTTKSSGEPTETEPTADERAGPSAEEVQTTPASKELNDAILQARKMVREYQETQEGPSLRPADSIGSAVAEKNDLTDSDSVDEEDRGRSESPERDLCIFLEKTTQYHLSTGTVLIGSDLQQYEKEQLVQLLQQYEHLFAFNDEIGDCALYEHAIVTGDHHPVACPPRRVSGFIAQIIREQVAKWLQQGILRESRSPWASAVVIVRKKDGTPRMCVDYRPLNKLTSDDVYPLPHLEDLLSNLTGAQHFSTIDLNQGYMQIRVRESDIPKTAVVTQDGLFEFVRMPFGLKTAPATFQRLMDSVLAGIKYNKCLVYLDDIIVFGRSLEGHNNNLSEVLNRLETAGLTIKPSKCAFGLRELRFLGHLIGKDGIRMDPNKIRAVIELQPPKNVSEVRSFIGMASYYRRFIEGFARIAEPLTRLTISKDKTKPGSQVHATAIEKPKTDGTEKFEWADEQQKAFDEIKEKLTSQPVLCHYDRNIPLELRTDACGYGLGAILLHVQKDGRKQVVAYASRLLRGAEKRYPITEKECLAMVWAVEKFKIYLQGVVFTIITDHRALVWMTDKKKLPERILRWQVHMQQYNFKVVFRNGVNHKDADHLSRFPLINSIRQQPQEDLISDDSASNRGRPAVDLDTIYREQQRDKFCRDALDNLREYPSFSVKDGILHEAALISGPPRIVVPIRLLNDILYGLHDCPLSGHCGFRKTLWKFRHRYYIKNACKLVKNYVKTCKPCQTRKHPWTRRVGLLRPIPPPERPFEAIGMDIVGPFRRSHSGNIKILVITDYATKYAIAKPMRTERSPEIAEVLLDEIYARYGSPMTILTDRGKNFQTQLLRDIYNGLLSKHISTTAYHPQTNGLTERFNRTLAVMLSMYVHKNHKDWDEYLQFVVFAYNSVIQDSTGYAPFYLLHGFYPRVPTDMIDPNDFEDPCGRFERLHEARELAIKASLAAQGRQKLQYDRTHYGRAYKVGDKVLIYRPRPYIGQTTKLRHQWEGPFEVTGVAPNSDLVYYVVNMASRKGKVDLVHIARMKPYYDRGDLATNSQDEEVAPRPHCQSSSP